MNPVPLDSSTAGSSNTGATNWTNAKYNESKTGVNFFSADQLLKSNVLGPIGLYHIDVEGGEEKVILGSKTLLKMFRPVMAVESWKEKDRKWKIEEDSPIKYLMKNLTPPYYPSETLSNGDIVYIP